MSDEQAQGAPENTNSIKIIRGQKGSYGWEVKVRWPVGVAAEQSLVDLKAIDDRLRSDYGESAE